jgi:putative ABC transport system permease protein
VNPTYIEISYLRLALAFTLIVVNLGISLWLRLGLARTLFVASVRMTVQLLILGFALEFIFALNTPLPIVGLALFMASLAATASVNRTRRRYAGIYWNSLVSVFGASFLVTGAAIAGIVQVKPWYEAQYLIPLLGMVLGNTLNGISLALDRFMEGVTDRRRLIEAQLAMGASRWEAAHTLIKESLRTGMIPAINSMMVMGLVSLPGMTTGQILAGALPIDAVRYQIVITFMIASATALGALGVTLLAYQTLFSVDHRLDFGKLSLPKRRGWI